MLDQANELRQLVRRDGGHGLARSSRSPWLIGVTSGKGGVGATTVAVNLAVALARAGRSTMLVDADLDGANVSSLCQLNETYSLAHVLSGARCVHEVLCRGPGGIQVLPGAWAPVGLAECSPQAQERLLAALRGLGNFAEFVVLDVGSGLNRVVRRFWHAVDQVLLVTTPDDTAVMNSYAAIKVLSDGDAQLPITTLINQASPQAAADVQERLARACRRFLGMGIDAAGRLANSSDLTSASRGGRPVVLDSPLCEVAESLEQLATFAIDRAAADSNSRVDTSTRRANLSGR